VKRDHPLDSETFPPFGGFPMEGLAFLKKLKRNNNRPWFQKHKSDYEDLVRFPMQSLVASLGEEMRSDAPEIEFNPRRSIFRIYRDVRFSKNKVPYKTNIGAAFPVRGRKGPTESPGLYLHIEPGQIFIGGGVYMPTGPQLKAIRKKIAADPSSFYDVIKDPGFRRMFGGIQGEKLTKAPLGYPKDHPMIEHLRHKQFYVGLILAEQECLKPGFLMKVTKGFRTAMPLVRWLADIR